MKKFNNMKTLLQLLLGIGNGISYEDIHMVINPSDGGYNWVPNYPDEYNYWTNHDLNLGNVLDGNDYKNSTKWNEAGRYITIVS